MEKLIAQVEIKNRDSLKLIEREGKIFLSVQGCEALRSKILQNIKEQGQNIKAWKIQGTSHADLLLKKLVDQLNSLKLPYLEDEVCHCRNISVETIEQSLFNGAHTVSAIRRTTTANTACGSCQTDVESILNHWLNPRK